MNKDKYLSVQWNNFLMLGLGIPALSYASVVFFTSSISEKSGFFGMVAAGIVYCLIVEPHSSMLLKWRNKNNSEYVPEKYSYLERFVVVIYNLIWWTPIVFPFAGIVGYKSGSIIFFLITFVRAMLNLYRINILRPEVAFHFPLRGPN
ncbi:MAG: hypothetical protein OEZ68_12395 [Gammaproteobacteria bacterium]|nr:hypothetical protein [Gammaproteobacteria bacterium]MDH5801595.1 hypothetical protein [Gammaproteobacteria bacterium]